MLWITRTRTKSLFVLPSDRSERSLEGLTLLLFLLDQPCVQTLIPDEDLDVWFLKCISTLTVQTSMSPIHYAPQDSVLLLKDIKAKKAIGMHWGLLRKTS
ncbi:hypothetical protein BKA70DRAFT_1245677 [Coprinopsis sp. MPI-PUGE-AT-0042]|nr:hypothetical protein BKA70DRAFT_1245677 [Coprinopsis sp. MPI-PUGE-AT-0042]